MSVTQADRTPSLPGRMAAVDSAFASFVETGIIDDAVVRPVVAQSWQRSRELAAVGASLGTAQLVESGLLAYRAQHTISKIRTVVRSLLVDHLGDCNVLVALTDAAGRVLWIEGDRQTRRRAGLINFEEGALWSEAVAGTNAPGVALETQAGVAIYRSEHFDPSVKAWSCAAAPVIDPSTGAIIGTIDVTGGAQVESAFALPTVVSVAAAAKEELATLAQPTRPRQDSVLRVLGSDVFYWTDPDGVEHHISRRHAEILLLLREFSEGVTTEDFIIALADAGLDPVTVRAEISRLRRIVGSDAVQSRPYRLTIPMRTDLDNVRNLLAHNEISAAIDAFGRGGLLASSSAPGIVELRENAVAALRAAVLQSADRTVLWSWVRSAYGRNDQAGWQALGDLLPDFEAGMAHSRMRLVAQRLGDS